MERIVGKRVDLRGETRKEAEENNTVSALIGTFIVTYRCSQLLALVTFDIRSDEGVNRLPRYRHRTCPFVALARWEPIDRPRSGFHRLPSFSRLAGASHS